MTNKGFVMPNKKEFMNHSLTQLFLEENDHNVALLPIHTFLGVDMNMEALSSLNSSKLKNTSL